MSLQPCIQHNKSKDTICARDQCILLVCQQCFSIHSETFQHKNGVKLNNFSKQFFIKWTQLIYQKICSYLQIILSLGYNKIFDMNLQQSHPSGLINNLDLKQIQFVIIQTLKQHQNITGANLNFVKATKNISQLIHPQFLKDLYNLIIQDAKVNLSNIPLAIKKRLVDTYKDKELYKYVVIGINQKEICQLEEERKNMLKQNQRFMMYQVSDYYKQPVIPIQTSQPINLSTSQPITQSSSQIRNRKPSIKVIQQQVIKIQHIDTFLTQTHSSSSHGLSTSNFTPSQIPLNSSNSPQQQKLVSIHSLTQSQANTQKLQIRISLLKSNQQMYKNKINKLQEENNQMKQKINEQQRLIYQKQIQIQKYNNNKQQLLTQSQQKINIILNTQQTNQLNQQINQLQITQQKLITQNHQLQDLITNLQDICQTRLHTIQSLQSQLKKSQQALNFKQKSIQQLNQLISNEQQQLSYRQNQVQILQQQIKKLINKNQFLQKSIHQLNNLISNQQQQIAYRQNQTKTLENQVKKLLNRIKQLEKSIKSLNQLIANEEQQLSYRENQSEILTNQVRKLIEKVKFLQKSIKQLNLLILNEQQEINYRESQSERLNEEIKKVIEKNKYLERQLQNYKNHVNLNHINNQKQSEIQKQTIYIDPNEELIQQTVLLQADLQNAKFDINLLRNVIEENLEQKSQQNKFNILSKLQKLRTIQVNQRL